MWKDATKKQQAAAALRYTAPDVKALGCVDDVIPEPPGGTQKDPAQAFMLVNEKLELALAQIQAVPLKDLLDARYVRFRNIAQCFTTV